MENPSSTLAINNISRQYQAFKQAIAHPTDSNFNLYVFGTGVLLRGLCLEIIAEAKANHSFQGNVLMFQNTPNDTYKKLQENNHQYSIHIQGVNESKSISEQHTNKAIDFCESIYNLNKEADNAFIQLAQGKNLKVVLSNTTEIGLKYINHNTSIEDYIKFEKENSYPATLCLLLYFRFQAKLNGIIIIATELIVDNALVLKNAVLQQAHDFQISSPEFLTYINEQNYFCSSLVDRIVTGKDLTLYTEPYKLWAVEGNEFIQKALPWQAEGFIVANSIAPYRERKLRLLNATHSLLCGLFLQLEYEFIHQIMESNEGKLYTQKLLFEEIIVATKGVEEQVKISFAQDLLNRFSNPYIAHQLTKITFQYTSKMQSRVMPLLDTYLKENKKIPLLLTLGIAGYLAWLKPIFQNDKGEVFGELTKKDSKTVYLMEDEEAQKHLSYFQTITDTSISSCRNTVLYFLQTQELWKNVEAAQNDAFKEQLILFYHQIVNKEGNIALRTALALSIG